MLANRVVLGLQLDTSFPGFPRQQGEHFLSDVFGQMGIAQHSARGGIDQVDVTLDELRKGSLGAVLVTIGKAMYVRPLPRAIRLDEQKRLPSPPRVTSFA